MKRQFNKPNCKNIQFYRQINLRKLQKYTLARPVGKILLVASIICVSSLEMIVAEDSFDIVIRNVRSFSKPQLNNTTEETSTITYPVTTNITGA